MIERFFQFIGRSFLPEKAPSANRYFLTKSRYLQNRKCSRLVWYLENNKNIKAGKDYKFGFETERVKHFAASAFGNSVILRHTSDKAKNIRNTKKAMNENTTVFNAALGQEELYTQIDIVEYENGRWNLYLLKNSPTLKKRDYITELAFQNYVAQKSGLDTGNLFVFHINSGYIKNGDPNFDDIFIRTDFTEEVKNIPLAEVEKSIDNTLQSIRDTSPDDQALVDCRKTKSCQVSHLCWESPADGDIFHLREGNEISIRHYNQGKRYLHEIPLDEELNFRQKIQIETGIFRNIHINRKEIQEFLSRIRYPLYYLDFETINSSIPVYEKTRPFQHVPFQFSLHIQLTEESPLEHLGFIDEGNGDPRQNILALLSEKILPGGTILCFEDTFEKRVLREAVEMFPEFSSWHMSIQNDFLDLAMPFKSFHYYHPEQKGSTSLKKVLHVVTGSGYESLQIQDGYSANYEFLRIVTGIDRGNREEVYRNLEEYCRQDTYSLHVILEHLRQLTGDI